jgi:hypothetical protein
MIDYILGLTEDLIGQYRLDDINETNSPDETLKHTVRCLRTGAVAKMNGSTLGLIMDCFEAGDVVVSSDEIMEHVKFTGNGSAMLRDMVAVCLAYTIMNRFNPNREPGIPGYPRNAKRT